MKKWTAVDSSDLRRWQTLSKSLQEAGCANEFIPWPGDLDATPALTDFSEFSHVRLATRHSASILATSPVQSAWISSLGVADGITQTASGWWPQCALYEAFSEQLISMGEKDAIDNRRSVFVAGAGGAARVAIAAFFRAGFQNFLLSSIDELQAKTLQQDIQSRFFGLQLQIVPPEKIVLLPGESEVLVNCTPITNDNKLMVELSYLNFLRRPGVLFDLDIGSETHVLRQEAQDSGVQVVLGAELAARADVLWAKWAFACSLNLSNYLTQLQKVLAETKVKPD